MAKAKSKPASLGVDQMICALRWLPLLLAPGLAYLSTFTQQQQIDSGLLLVLTLGGLAYNAIATLMAYGGLFPPAAAWAFLLLDLLFSVGFLIATNFCACPLFTLGLFAAVEGTLRFDWVVGLVGAVVVAFTAGMGPVILNDTFSLDLLWPASLGLGTLLVAVGATGGIVDRLRQQLARVREEELEALRRTNERAQAIYEMSSALTATLDYERALEAILDISLMGLRELEALDERPVAVLLLYGPEGMYVATARHMKREDEARIISGEDGLVADALSSGDPVVVRNLFRDSELSQFVSLRTCRSAILVPLRAGFDIYGAVIIASPKPEAFTEEHQDLVSSVCTQAVMALQNAQLYQELRDERDRIMDQQEEARAQLARDLHDGPTQSVSAITMRLNYVKSLLHRDPLQARKELDDLEALARRTTREIRTMLFTLRPQILETQGLVAAVEHYLERVREDVDFAIHLETMDLGDALDINMQTVTFNIIEEALNNVKKHAECQNVWVRLALRNGVFVAEVQDDGAGFDVKGTMDSYDQRGSLGLLNLYERAQLVDGKTEIQSQPGQGTTVTLVIPLSNKKQ